MYLDKIARNIKKEEDDIYYSNKTSKISYPINGNENCMQIEQDSFWFNHRNRIIIEAVKKYSKTKILYDIGGGNGFVSKGLQDAGISVVLVEPGLEGAKNAKKRKINNVICSTFDDAGFEKSSLDTVGLFDVVEHIENDIDFLKNINCKLKRNGLIYITVPAYNFLWSNEDIKAGHHRRYSLTKLNKTLLESGYSIEYSTYIFSILPIPIYLFRSLPSTFGLRKELNRHKKEHSKKGILSKLIQIIWNWELNNVLGSKTIKLGGSCFVIGKKI